MAPKASTTTKPVAKPVAKPAAKPAANTKAAAAAKPVEVAPVTAASRPLVSVRKLDDGDKVSSQVTLPTVFVAPIRPDIVHFVHTNISKNRRQPYAVSPGAGHQHSAESWGTGRAVARIPRVSGGGTSRAGQGAFGNMCRKGRMFAPTKTWRRWHRKVNVNQKRFAVASALAASALPGLVFGRGHIINTVPEIPLVIDSAVEKVSKTKQAIDVLKAVGAFSDVAKARDSKKLRAGKGKMRGRRYVSRRGPLVVYQNDDGLVEAFRNLPGVEVAHVDRLNLLQLAPGGHLGRFIVWSQNAFDRLNAVWGSFNRQSTQKKGYTLPRPLMVQSDLTRLINSEEIQSHVRPAIKGITRRVQKKNPLTNLGARVRLNPYATVMRRAELLAQERSAAARKAKVDAKRKNAQVQLSAQETAAKKADAAFEKKHRKTKIANYKRLIAAQ